MKRPGNRRASTPMRLIAATAALLFSVASSAIGTARCPHCESSGGVEFSLDSGTIIGTDEAILSEVIVQPVEGVCPHCRSVEPTAPIVWVGEQETACDAGPSVRDELMQRRFNDLEACDGLMPRLQLRAGVVYMDRLRDDFGVLIESSSNPLDQVNAEDFRFDWQVGLDASASQVCWDNNQFEVRFLGLSEFTANQHVDVGLSEVRINSDPPVFVPDIERFDARLESQLYGFELNYHYVTYCPFNYVAGFRYVSFDEDLSAQTSTDPNSFVYQTTTRNDLYGLQLGIENAPELPLFGWRCLTWFGKVGIYGNDAQQRTILDTGLGQIVSESPDTSAVVWEFGVGLDLPLSDCFSFQGGYSALILDRVSVATDQLSKIDFLSATGSDNRGTVMFHGATLAITFSH